MSEIDERIHMRDQGTGRDIGRNPLFNGTGMSVGRKTIYDHQSVVNDDNPMEVGAWTERDNVRLSRGAVPNPFGASGIAISGPNVYMGCAIKDGGTGSEIWIRDRNANGSVIRGFILAANEVVNDYVTDGINVNNIYIQIVTGTVAYGTLYTGAVE